MTKAELLQFLEPYDNDTIILVEQDMCELDEPNPRYRLAGVDEVGFDEEQKLGLTKLEGYVLL